MPETILQQRGQHGLQVLYEDSLLQGGYPVQTVSLILQGERQIYPQI